MLKRKGYTLIEILVVLVIIGTLAALAWPNYLGIKEKTLNREAKASLALIRAAEKIYRMEAGFYYPPGTAENNVQFINRDLKLSLPDSASASWSITLPGGSVGVGTATRTGVGADGRVWTINFSGDADPTCSGSETSCL